QRDGRRAAEQPPVGKEEQAPQQVRQGAQESAHAASASRTGRRHRAKASRPQTTSTAMTTTPTSEVRTAVSQALWVAVLAAAAGSTPDCARTSASRMAPSAPTRGSDENTVWKAAVKVVVPTTSIGTPVTQAHRRWRLSMMMVARVRAITA